MPRGRLLAADADHSSQSGLPDAAAHLCSQADQGSGGFGGSGGHQKATAMGESPREKVWGVMILYQYRRAGIFARRFPIGTSMQDLHTWVQSRQDAFRTLGVYRLEVQDLSAPVEPPY